MKLVFNDKQYEFTYKSKMNGNMWYSTFPLKFTIPLIPIKEWEEMKYKTTDIINLTILKEKDEFVDFKESKIEEIELWEIKVRIESSIISSVFKDGVRIVINLNVFENEKLPKLELRDILLNDLLR